MNDNNLKKIKEQQRVCDSYRKLLKETNVHDSKHVQLFNRREMEERQKGAEENLTQLLDRHQTQAPIL